MEFCFQIALLLVSGSEERLGGQELLHEGEGFLAEAGLLKFLLASGLAQFAVLWPRCQSTKGVRGGLDLASPELAFAEVTL